MFGLELPTLISRIFTLIIAFTVHEFSHAKVADWFGDDTPRMNGRLTLNPLKHLDIFGSLMLVIAGFGWAKPVPVNPYALSRRSPAGYMWVSLAGPASNLFMAIVAAAPLRLNWICRFINLLLMLFNLIPLAPLDGDKLYSYFAPPPIARALDVIRPYGQNSCRSY